MAALFGRFSKPAEVALIEAQKLAERLNRPVDSDVLLLALATLNGSPASELLRQSGATYQNLVQHLNTFPENANPGKEVQYVLEESIKLASKYRFNLVEIELIAYILVRDEKLQAYQLLKRAEIDPHVIMSRLSEWLLTVTALFNTNRQTLTQSTQPNDDVDLEKYTQNLSILAENKVLDPVVGRAAELDQMIHILLRRRKNNPLLIGEPGVGKTALVDALATRIAAGKVPQPLLNKRIITLDLASVVAGTMYRGQFEERLKNIINEIATIGDCIVFIDEVHTLSGGGSSEGSFDAANILKPALSRGEITLIGATTQEEYRKSIRKDKALDRRFQVVQVAEPSTEEALAMLKGMKKVLEEHHHVTFTPATLKAAVELSTRYIHDKFLPDKAIDILDEAATYHVKAVPQIEGTADLQREVNLVAMQKAELVERAASLEDWEVAKELSAKERQLLQILNRLQKKATKKEPKSSVSMDDVIAVIAKRTGIPASQMKATLEPLHIRTIMSTLKTHVLGQEQALETIGKALIRAELNLQPSKQPLGSFLLVGPTGVGKTETARIIAEHIFGEKSALIKVDMSEFMERHTVSNLIGAPAGYVGFEQGGSLTEKVSKKPYSVVLFDEVEKAHPDVFNVLLQILEDGVLTDNTGRSVSFAHTIILMTSNIGMQSFQQVGRIGFEKNQNPEELQNHIEKELKSFFKPELLGRLSGIVYYQTLNAEVVLTLVKKRFEVLRKKLHVQGVTLKADRAFFIWAVGQYNQDEGARSIEKLFLHSVEHIVIDAMLDSKLPTTFTLTSLHNILTIREESLTTA